jgi:hypothetical protein
LAVHPIKLELEERGDGLAVKFTYKWEGRVPNEPEREAAVKTLLKRAFTGFVDKKAVWVGFGEDEKKNLRRDDWTIPREG